MHDITCSVLLSLIFANQELCLESSWLETTFPQHCIKKASLLNILILDADAEKDWIYTTAHFFNALKVKLGLKSKELLWLPIKSTHITWVTCCRCKNKTSQGKWLNKLKIRYWIKTLKDLRSKILLIWVLDVFSVLQSCEPSRVMKCSLVRTQMLYYPWHKPTRTQGTNRTAQQAYRGILGRIYRRGRWHQWSQMGHK